MLGPIIYLYQNIKMKIEGEGPMDQIMLEG